MNQQRACAFGVARAGYFYIPVVILNNLEPALADLREQVLTHLMEGRVASLENDQLLAVQIRSGDFDAIQVNAQSSG
ncbi:hypothetical protein D3C86_2109050 [compost metagenome]